MGLQSELSRQGNWLFRWRSYLPLVIAPLLILAVITMRWPFGSYALHEVIEFTCLGVSLFGLLIRAVAVGYAPAGTSGRNTKGQVAESLNTTGLYSLVRHPLYVGNYLIALGVVLVPAVWWLPVIYTLIFWIYYERIMYAEEAFLRERFGDTFSEWARVTPAFIPNLRNWRKPSLPFSFVNVLKREYTALALIVLLHAGIEAAEHLFIDHKYKFGTVWVVLVCLAMGSYLLLRTLKRHTNLLNVAGR